MSDSRQYDTIDMDNFYLAEENRRLLQLVDDLMADNLALHQQVADLVDELSLCDSIIDGFLNGK